MLKMFKLQFKKDKHIGTTFCLDLNKVLPTFKENIQFVLFRQTFQCLQFWIYLQNNH